MGKAFGVPYCGSKNAFADKIIGLLPSADVFVDMFAGGCAVAHAALLSGKYKRIIINDINPLPTQLFMDACCGKYKDENRWISHDEFMQLRDTDPFVAYCWSFGNSPKKGYMYSRHIEPFKKALHYKWVFGDDSLWNEILQNPDYEELLKNKKRLQSKERLEHLQCLERIKQFEQLDRHCEDYRNIVIPDNAVVYCDIPYRDTWGGYSQSGEKGFDYDSFYDWARQRECWISEYQMPNDFECIAEIERHCHLSAKPNERKYYTEKVFHSNGKNRGENDERA